MVTYCDLKHSMQSLIPASLQCPVESAPVPSYIPSTCSTAVFKRKWTVLELIILWIESACFKQCKLNYSLFWMWFIMHWKNKSFLQNKNVKILGHCPDFLLSAFLCVLLTLFFLFYKDIVGTGRTMKVLLNNIEKYKPKMIKVARWVKLSQNLVIN